MKRFRRRVFSLHKQRKKRISYQGKSRLELKEAKLIKKYRVVTAPKWFSLIDKPEETIAFINKLEDHYLHKRKVFVNLRSITHLDYSAVTVLVSVMFSFKSRKIEFNGNFPRNKRLANLLISSEFFKFLFKESITDKIQYTLGKENQIFTQAHKEVNSEIGYLVMQEVSRTIWGVKRTCKGLQRTLLELMQNTNNHADSSKKGIKHWWLSVNHDKIQRKVSFVFVDYGIGIFESLKNKPPKNKWFGWAEKIAEKLRYGGNDEILKLLMNGDIHRTVTGEDFRGKGLPGIKEVWKRNQISNLCIVSNNVIGKVSEENFSKLNTEFSGTFVSWELNQLNENSEWIG